MSATFRRPIVKESRHGQFHRFGVEFEEPGCEPVEFVITTPVQASAALVARQLRELAAHIEQYTAAAVDPAPPRAHDRRR